MNKRKTYEMQLVYKSKNKLRVITQPTLLCYVARPITNGRLNRAQESFHEGLYYTI